MASTTAVTTLTKAGNNAPSKMKSTSQIQSDDGFYWTDQEEPHRTRRIQIIKAHPEVTKLCGPEPLTKYLVLLVLAIQLLCAISLRHSPILSAPFIATAYVVGATANQNLFLAIHEISHNLAFKSPLSNRLFAVFANLPIGAPYSAAFRVGYLRYHWVIGVPSNSNTALPPDPPQIPRRHRPRH